MKHAIDPRTTRRRIPALEWARNAARYATFKLVGKDGPTWVVIERKLEFIKHG